MAIIQMTRKQVEGITMSSPTNSKISFRSVPVIKIALVFMCFLITGCTTDSTNFSNFNRATHFFHPDRSRYTPK